MSVETNRGGAGARDAGEAAAPALTRLDVKPVEEPLPPEIDAFLVDVGARIDVFFEERRNAKHVGFYPSDYPLAYGMLQALKRLEPPPHRFCEWGSGFGVVTGLGAFLGYEACGIEIDPWLIKASRQLLKEYHLQAEILEGSFVPEEYARSEQFSDSETLTILSGAGCNDEVDVEIEDFDVVFAFPWPTEEGMYRDLFARTAAHGALLVTYHALEEFRVFRKTGRAILNR